MGGTIVQSSFLFSIIIIKTVIDYALILGSKDRVGSD